MNPSRYLAMAFCLVTSLLLVACGKAPPQTTANGESLHGTWDESNSTVAVFRGVPFAAPPVGNLRWRAPQPHTPRSGTVAAEQFAAACPQGDYIVDWYAQLAEAFGSSAEVVQRPVGESEDCLYLNIWTPDLQPEAPLPVMVYVHGGANQGGWSYEPNYLGEKLAARGVVVVSISYRLGPLGFFSHAALGDGSEEAVANFGLLDIAQAFQWVRANIASFGGAADNVTAFGESSGAGNLIDLALATDSASDALFERLIAQSTGGAVNKRRSLAQEQKLGSQLVAALGLPDSASVEELRAQDWQALLQAGKQALPDHYYDAVIDGRLLLQQPVAGLAGPQASRLEIVIGTNKDEELMYLDEGIGEAELMAWLLETVPEYSGTLRDAVSDAADPRRALDRLKTARQMLCPSRLIAEKASAAGGQGFMYWFTRQRPGPGGEALGAYHGAELPYVFDQHDEWLPGDATDQAVTDAMMAYWVAFAQNGTPRAAGLAEWPMYTAATPWVLEFSGETTAIQAPDSWLCHYLAPRIPQ
ncbi:MAG TPA: carboxylesterase family protein [Xanthomonadales bacterium]|nr:carboxylesterase family protein [Xanthomonadales bacterium]